MFRGDKSAWVQNVSQTNSAIACYNRTNFILPLSLNLTQLRCSSLHVLRPTFFILLSGDWLMTGERAETRQEAQLPQRNSASAVHVYLQHRLANWSCNTQNTAESQRLFYFLHSNALIQEVLADNAFCHEIATQGHSRSFTLQSFAGRQGVAYRHILLLAVSLKFSKT